MTPLASTGARAQAVALPCVRVPGAVAVFSGVRHYRTTRSFDPRGAVVRFPQGASFEKMELTAYVEAGLTSRVTAVVSASAGRLAAEPATGAARVNWGAANPELGVLASIGDMPGIGQVFCAAQVLVKLPVRSGGDPLFGFDQTDVDVRLRSVRPFSLAAGGWWQGDVAYRTRFGAPADELRADLTSGLRLTPRLGVIAQAFGTVALQNRVGAVLPSNPTISANYSSASVQGSLLLRLASTWELQPALRRELWGRAAGAGTELSLLVWHHF